MSTLEGAVPLGLGITKLRLWDELHRAHCEALQPSHSASSSSSRSNPSPNGTSDRSVLPGRGEVHRLDRQSKSVASKRSHEPDALTSAQKRQREIGPVPAFISDLQEVSVDFEPTHSYRQGCSFDWLLTNRDSSHGSAARASTATCNAKDRHQEPPRDSQGVLMPPPPPRPGPSRRKPPLLVARIKAKARRAKRKQQKAEYRRRLFLAHMVQATQTARQQNAAKPPSSQSSTNSVHASVRAKSIESTSILPPSAAQRQSRQALSMFPESLGEDLASFVEVVFDTDAQSSEITAPSDISDDDLAWATKTEIETRKKLGGADVVVPKGVFRWMVARDFAERWPQKVKGVRKNPWPGLEDVWGSPSGVTGSELAVDKRTGQVEGEEEPFRWQSGRRSRFIRRKEKAAAPLSSQVKTDCKQVRSSADTGSETTTPPEKLANAAAAMETSRTLMATADQTLLMQNRLPTLSMTLQPSVSRIEQTGLPIVPQSIQAEAASCPMGVNIRPQAGRAHHQYGMSDAFASSWDRSSAFTCSRSTAPPSTLAGLPISL